MKVYKESDCASPCHETLREFRVIDSFYQQASTAVTYPFTLFNINFPCCHVQKWMDVLKILLQTILV